MISYLFYDIIFTKKIIQYLTKSRLFFLFPQYSKLYKCISHELLSLFIQRSYVSMRRCEFILTIKGSQSLYNSNQKKIIRSLIYTERREFIRRILLHIGVHAADYTHNVVIPGGGHFLPNLAALTR